VIEALSFDFGELPPAWVCVLLAASGAAYAGGAWRLWRRAGIGRGLSLRRVISFWAGWVSLAASLIGPLDELGDRLFCMHMVQHEVMMLVAAPLIVVGRPLAAWAWAAPRRSVRALAAFFHRPGWRAPWLVLTRPTGAGVVHALALWLWHLPAWFDAALANEQLHALQHAAFFGSALLFWWSVLHGAVRRRRGAVLLSLFVTMVHTGALGAILTLSRTGWYLAYAQSTGTFGLDQLQDQQLGGLVMWVPTSFVYLGCGLLLASRWMSPERNDSSPRIGRSAFGPDRSPVAVAKS